MDSTYGIGEARNEEARKTKAAALLHGAFQKGDMTEVGEILKTGADVNSRDEQGRTVLHLAVQRGKSDDLEVLLNHRDIDMNALNLRRLLLRRGASTEIIDDRGHLPSFYATSPQVIKLFDNPPKVLDQKLGSTKYDSSLKIHPFVSNTAEAVPPPTGLQKTLAEAFRGSVWEPTSECKWSSSSIWDLVYNDSEDATSRRAARPKWIHLSCATEGWAKDLATNICAAGGYSPEKSRAMRNFISRIFNTVDAEGPVRERHFIREGKSDTQMGDEEMCAMVLPIIDVDKRKYIEEARKHHDKSLEAGRFAATTWGTTDPVSAAHLTRMLQLVSFLDHPLPRSLDQAYHEFLDPQTIKALDEDQVLTRYMRRLKRKNVEIVQTSSERRRAVKFKGDRDESLVQQLRVQDGGGSGSDQKISAIMTSPDDPPTIRPVQAGKEDAAAGISTQDTDNIITVPYFWLFRLGSGTVITLYSERWDKANEATLHNHLFSSVSNNKDIHESLDKFKINGLVKAIFNGCLSFEARAFARFMSPGVNNDDCHNLEVSYIKAYSNSIAETYTKVTDRFHHLKGGLGSLSGDPGAFYRDVKKETEILMQTNDTIAEMGIILRILKDQSAIGDQFRGASSREPWKPKGDPFAVSSLKAFLRLENDVDRVRSMVTTLLDLRQREATIEDALSMSEQTTLLFIFTTVTVLFAPLAFVCGLLAMRVDGLPESWSAPALAEVFGLSTLGTLGLCLLMWALHKIYQTITLSLRSKEPPHLEHRRPTETANVVPGTAWGKIWKQLSKNSGKKHSHEFTRAMEEGKGGSATGIDDGGRTGRDLKWLPPQWSRSSRRRASATNV